MDIEKSDSLYRAIAEHVTGSVIAQQEIPPCPRLPASACELVRECWSDIETYVLSQADPVMACRLRAMDLMHRSASFYVLVTRNAASIPYVSGHLGEFVIELATIDASLKRFLGSLDPVPLSSGEMTQVVMSRFRFLNLLVCTYNIVRLHLGDAASGSGKDWFHACYFSQCISQEDHYRRLLGLPTLIEGVTADLKVEMFLSWPDIALESANCLRTAWEESWRCSFQEPSPFLDQRGFKQLEV